MAHDEKQLAAFKGKRRGELSLGMADIPYRHMAGLPDYI